MGVHGSATGAGDPASAGGPVRPSLNFNSLQSLSPKMLGTSNLSDLSNDLSPYELARLQRIQANKAVLASLGIQNASSMSLTSTAKPVSAPNNEEDRLAALAKEKKKKQKRVASERDASEAATNEEPERRSKRIRGVRAPKIEIGDDDVLVTRAESPERATNDGAAAQDDDEELTRVRYDSIPLGPETLDDNEFEAYLVLRKWRLLLSRKLEKEPYKIFQNRTLAEAVRRERNDPSWGETAEGLLECWGIGPSKAAEGGFAWDLVEQLKRGDVIEKLDASRRLGGLPSKEEDDASETEPPTDAKTKDEDAKVGAEIKAEHEKGMEQAASEEGKAGGERLVKCEVETKESIELKAEETESKEE